ncbi:Ldh family oxidoreductase [Bacillus sp. JJ1521]|uniref:Ldh family oxidoreductase n=1 Tax=Bacillus sp. JJ1521 TaxID=3122957 RepID=UPI003000E04C
MDYRINAKDVVELCVDILIKHDVEEKDAITTVQSLIDADLMGINSHGIIRLPLYLRNLKDKNINKAPSIQVISKSKNTAVIDGGNGLGQVVSQQAIDMIIEETKEVDIFAISVRNSNHFGTARYWAEQLQKHNLIGIATSNVPPIMPPTGGAEAKVGNNPMSVAIPSGNEKPIILDMATSNVPFGRILDFQSKGMKIPEGWAVNAAGESTTDPDEVVKGGYLFPVGGPKGYGLSVIIEALCSLLSNGAIGSDIQIKHNTPINVSHFFLGIRVDSFIDINLFKNNVDHYIQFIKNTKPMEGVSEIYLPGEIELGKVYANKEKGLLIPDSILKEIISLAEEVEVEEEFLLPIHQLMKKSV